MDEKWCSQCDMAIGCQKSHSVHRCSKGKATSAYPEPFSSSLYNVKKKHGCSTLHGCKFFPLWRTYLQLICRENCGSTAENGNQALFSKEKSREEKSKYARSYSSTEDTFVHVLKDNGKKGKEDDLGRSSTDGRHADEEVHPGKT